MNAPARVFAYASGERAKNIVLILQKAILVHKLIVSSSVNRNGLINLNFKVSVVFLTQKVC